jgi:hypothetical protein
VTLLDSLLDAIIRLDGEALIMHVGEKPYVVLSSTSVSAFRGPLSWGQVELSSRPLSADAVMTMLGQMLSPEQRHMLDDLGAIEHEIDAPGGTDERFVVTAARGGDDVWVEVRRRSKAVEVPALPAPAIAEVVEAAGIEAAGVEAGLADADRTLASEALSSTAVAEHAPEHQAPRVDVESAAHGFAPERQQPSYVDVDAAVRARAAALEAEAETALAAKTAALATAAEAALAGKIAALSAEAEAELAATKAALAAAAEASIADKAAALAAEAQAALAAK